MKDNQKKVGGETRQVYVAGCMMFLLVICLTGVFVSRKIDASRQQQMALEEQLRQAELAKLEQETEKVDVIIPPKSEEPKDQVTEIVKEEQLTRDAKEEAEENSETEAVSVVGPSAVASAPTHHFAKKLMWPVDGEVVIPYSMEKTAYFATLDQYKYNPAVIIGSAVGTNVKAAATGTITDIYENEEMGQVVCMDIGDGYTVSYGQLADVLYGVGATIEAGDVIGAVAEPTKYYSVEGANLYFALEKDGEPVAPMDYFE